mmetsp:Transcript_34258/g.84842  ORF Transcript_34258/g.84842 Transcript_34258/m.84842 type:complete len:420 (-) Transcript_34258:1220-2479(-)
MPQREPAGAAAPVLAVVVAGGVAVSFGGSHGMPHNDPLPCSMVCGLSMGGVSTSAVVFAIVLSFIGNKEAFSHRSWPPVVLVMVTVAPSTDPGFMFMSAMMRARRPFSAAASWSPSLAPLAVSVVVAAPSSSLVVLYSSSSCTVVLVGFALSSARCCFICCKTSSRAARCSSMLLTISCSRSSSVAILPSSVCRPAMSWLTSGSSSPSDSSDESLRWCWVSSPRSKSSISACFSIKTTIWSSLASSRSLRRISSSSAVLLASAMASQSLDVLSSECVSRSIWRIQSRTFSSAAWNDSSVDSMDDSSSEAFLCSSLITHGWWAAGSWSDSLTELSASPSDSVAVAVTVVAASLPLLVVVVMVLGGFARRTSASLTASSMCASAHACGCWLWMATVRSSSCWVSCSRQCLSRLWKRLEQCQ